MASIPTRTISCIICAYNEADRIENILHAVVDHPLLSEIIVVNDGSTDSTSSLLSTYATVRTISYSPNRGKTYALGRGIQETTGELVMLLDADLSGVSSEDISRLAAPVLSGIADVSISLRRNSLGIYRFIKLDFVSGERVIPRSLANTLMESSAKLPRWSGEAFMNKLIIQHKLRIAVVAWPTVFNIRKYVKAGRKAGLREEARMIRDALQTTGVLGSVTQNIQLLRLKVKTPHVAKEVILQK
jgi:glycosyltransferase involved in cell wall biosynthesis